MAEIFKKKIDELDQFLSKHEFISSKLELIQSKTGIPKYYIISGEIIAHLYTVYLFLEGKG